MRARLIAGLALVALGCGAGYVPPNLTPQASLAWRATKAIHQLDLARDIAQDGAATLPPIVSEGTARKVTQYHRATVSVLLVAVCGVTAAASSPACVQGNATGPKGVLAANWYDTAIDGLDEVTNALPPSERPVIGPYLALVRVALKEVR